MIATTPAAVAELWVLLFWLLSTFVENLWETMLSKPREAAGLHGKYLVQLVGIADDLNKEVHLVLVDLCFSKSARLTHNAP